MIERYSLPEMKALWELNSKYKFWLQVELAVCEAYREIGIIPNSDFDKIINLAKYDSERIIEIENDVKHDFIAFLTNINENLGDVSGFMHMGLTSSDVIDTALSLQIRQANFILFDDLTKLIGILRIKALEYKDTIMIGRTHGIHAEPITMGLKFALWYDVMKRNYIRLSQSAEELYVGKIAGAVGTYANVDPRIEQITCRLLELKPVNICTQIIQRDIHARYIQSLSLIASCIDQIATELRSLQRTEILEVEEGFSNNQKGSSAMPHKKNPISGENLCGLARIVRSYSVAALEDVVLWNERDISHSSAERIMIPDSTILLNYMIDRLTKTIDKLQVYPENMLGNLNKCGGIIFSQRIMLKLVEKGLTREKAYRIVQKNAHQEWNTLDGNFKQALVRDENITNHLDITEIEECFDPSYHLENIDYIYDKLGLVY